jgi:acyl-CoA thioester hydrolase
MTYDVPAPSGKMFDKTFVFPVRVYYEDTDAGGIVYYANYLKFAERARTEFLRYIGAAKQQNALQEDMCGFVVRHAEIDYRASARLDDALTVSCTVTEEGGASAVMYQEICRGDEVLAVINVKVVYVGLAKKRPIKIPEDIRNRLKGL